MRSQGEGNEHQPVRNCGGLVKYDQLLPPPDSSKLLGVLIQTATLEPIQWADSNRNSSMFPIPLTLPETNIKKPLKTDGRKMKFPFGPRPIFRGELAVSFRECNNLQGTLGWILCSDKRNTRLWFQICFIFTPIWGRFQFWLIFFNWVETTN